MISQVHPPDFSHWFKKQLCPRPQNQSTAGVLGKTTLCFQQDSNLQSLAVAGATWRESLSESLVPREERNLAMGREARVPTTAPEPLCPAPVQPHLL